MTRISVSELCRNFAEVLKRVRRSNQPILITYYGQAAAILLNVEMYRRSEHERDLLRLLAQGEREIAAGRGFDLDSVLGETDDLLTFLQEGTG